MKHGARAMNDDLARIERSAVDMAREAGDILARYFGGNLDIQYKDDHRNDPVTNADRDVQDFLVGEIARGFPDHGILGEEDDEKKSDDRAPAPDFVWVLDPLDGTKNFLHGLPAYACSIGVLYRGEPVVGAVFTSWPSSGGGVVHHAHRGGGAFADDKPIRVAELEGPQNDQLVTVPGWFDRLYRFDKPMRGRTGDHRVTGSIAYELVLLARGVTQYMYTSTPHLWDVAGGVAVAMEAGASVMVGRHRPGPLGLLPSIDWTESTDLVENWDEGVTMAQLRRWARPLLLGSPPVARFVSSNLGWRRSPSLLMRKLRRQFRRQGRSR